MKAIFLILGSFLVVVTQCQEYRRVDSRNAKILQEARYLQGGTHGSAYVQDDGTEFKEETDADGTRIGSYSYVDEDGKKIAVQYTAGKMGFMVTGDHLPKAPQPVQPSQQQQQPQYHQGPTISQQQYNTNPQFSGIPQQPQPQPNPAQFSYSFGDRHEEIKSYDANSLNGIGNHRFTQFQPQNNYQQGFIPTPSTTPTPSRYFTPGKLNLNRTPDGFQYSYSSD